MQKIKLNEPFNFEGKMVKIVECGGVEDVDALTAYATMPDQPKKERWFKFIGTERVLKETDIIPMSSSTVLEWENMYPHGLQEVTPDFICQHSGEAFMNGDNYWSVLALEKSENVILGCKFLHENSDKFAYFSSKEDALAWQEKKFGKKKEEYPLKEAEEIFKRHWARVTSLPYDEHVKSHMMYCIEAIQEALNKGGKQ